MKSLIPINKESLEEKKYFSRLYRKLKKYYRIETPADEIQLNLLITDLLRLKAAYARMNKAGQFKSMTSNAGNTYDTVSPVGFYINQIEREVRSHMRELVMTRKSISRKEKAQDFSNFAAEVIDVKPTGTSEKVSESEGKT